MRVPTNEETTHLKRVGGDLPPSPPETVDGESPILDPAAFPLPSPSHAPTQVLDIDKKTPDSHVARDPRLIRLTGVHPFNVEAPLSDLYNEGFLTSPELFYVRNHGAVPEVHDEGIPDWEFTIEGLVEHPMKLTLRELMSNYDQITCPITLVCAGNRRKEQNQVRKSKGFSWGSAGVSTALFTSVTFADVLQRARPKKRARYPNGYYGTSVKMNWVLDPNKGMMLAYKMNGEMLRPDHGKPLRTVIPGQIGGRSVKWLKRIILTDVPSDNWYHIYDNRVLPTSVSPDEAANNPAWWKDERYAIYDLSTNSAIAYPAHEEQLWTIGAPENYRVKGYAYGGGGRRVTRVEVSIDKGKTWRLSKIDYAEDRYREAREQELFGGTLDMSWRESSFCWCFWNVDIPISELKQAKDILVRAMDESMNIQPRDMYWSALGMMNNPWYRVTISHENDYLRFEHPTQPALIPGGWMERVKKAGGNLMNGYWGERIDGEEPEAPVAAQAGEIKMTKDGVSREISIDELRKHDNAENPWFVLNGEVYDGTAFMKDHPGGAQSIISAVGLDSTDEFMAIHSETANGMMPSYHMGSLDEVSRRVLREGEVQADPSAEPRPVFLNSRNWTRATLHSKESVSWDTRIFKFKLEHDTQTLGLPTGQHLMIRLRDPVTREAIIRSYTPISETSQKGYLDVLVKVYFDTKERKGGKMTKAMDALPIGHFIDFKGPIGKFEYLSRGRCTVNGVERFVKQFIMICGGSSITPIYQVFRAIMQDKEDKTKCIVLDGNRWVEDILCAGGLEGAQGQEHAPAMEHTMVLICGPETLEKSVHLALNELGWPDGDLLFF